MRVLGGEVVFPETDEKAMVKVRKEAAEALKAEAENRRQHAGLGVAISEYQEASNPARHRVNRIFKETYKDKMNSQDSAVAEQAKAEFKRVTAEDQATLYAADLRFKEQRRRLNAGEALLPPK